MADLNSVEQVDVDLPIPISLVQNRYLVFSVDAILYLRRDHNICGVFIGTIPHISTQNVFLGAPMELMPEEARVLVERGVACIVDDAKLHREGIYGLSEEERNASKHTLEGQGREAAELSRREQDRKKEAHFAKERSKKGKGKAKVDVSTRDTDVESSATVTEEEESLFASPSPTPSTPAPAPTAEVQQWHITPLTSYPPLTPTPSSPAQIPPATKSYPLFAHLHAKKYFLTPGLRFGCNYCVYPGDPLRFHSHFLAVGKEWDEEFDLLDLVGGGRLGTAVKKGFLLGGRETKAKIDAEDGLQDQIEVKKEDGYDDVRTFCIEWAGM